MVLEPHVGAEFAKYSNNAGAVGPHSSYVPSALSHFSFEVLQRRGLLCDIQGNEAPDSFWLTDPAIHTLHGVATPKDSMNLGEWVAGGRKLIVSPV